MLSVLTLTYRRQHLLEEAIESFLRQAIPETEMVILNDCADMWYCYDHPQIRIYNSQTRVSSLGKKLEAGVARCQFPYIYRLDDDDLLAPQALATVCEALRDYPGHDIYRSDTHYYFNDNQFVRVAGSTNNGNVYATSYLQRIQMPDSSFGEDYTMTFGHDAAIHTLAQPTMIYRWGMGTYHMSGLGEQPSDVLYAVADQVPIPAYGPVTLTPRFAAEYWAHLPLDGPAEKT